MIIALAQIGTYAQLDRIEDMNVLYRRIAVRLKKKRSNFAVC